MALFNSFTFGDVRSEDYGVYISGDSVYDSPARSVDLVQVPGRNGALALDNGYYENIEVTYPAGSFGTSQEEWREKMLGIRNALAAQRGYQKLIDTYHPEHYRLGMFFAGISASPVQYNRAGQFPIRFNCKPQRFLISGDTPVEFTAEGQEEVYGPASIASFEAEEGVEIRQLEVDLEPVQDLNGQSSPWPAGGGKNISSASEAVTNSNGNVTASTSGTFGDCKANVQYTISFSVLANSATTINLRYNNGANIKSWTAAQVVTGARLSYTYTPTVDGSFNFYSSGNSFAASTKVFDKIQVEEGAQATDYAPYSNICPISGHTEVNVVRTGKNLIKYRDDIEIPTTYNGITYSWGENGAIILNGTASAVSYINITKADDPTPFRTGTEYHFKLFGAIEGITLPLRKDSTWVGSSDEYSYTFPEFDTAYLRLRIASGTVCNNLEVKPMVSLQTQWTNEYEPPAVATYPISLGQTVYGGTLNVTTGVLTIDRAIGTISTLSWVAGTASGRTYFKAAVSGKHVPTSADTTHPIVATNIKYAGVLTVAQMPDVSLAQAPGNTEVRIYDSSVTTLSAMQDKYGTGQFVYYLATPTTVQLTATQVSTLLGQNNIWADAGEVEVKVASPVDLTNPTNFPAKPLIRVYGNGSVRVGDTIATVQNNADGYVDIDCESMNCYDTTGGRNADVSFSGNDFPELASGNNGILLTGPSKVEITPRWWEL